MYIVVVTTTIIIIIINQAQERLSLPPFGLYYSCCCNMMMMMMKMKMMMILVVVFVVALWIQLLLLLLWAWHCPRRRRRLTTRSSSERNCCCTKFKNDVFNHICISNFGRKFRTARAVSPCSVNLVVNSPYILASIPHTPCMLFLSTIGTRTQVQKAGIRGVFEEKWGGKPHASTLSRLCQLSFSVLNSIQTLPAMTGVPYQFQKWRANSKTLSVDYLPVCIENRLS